MIKNKPNGLLSVLDEPFPFVMDDFVPFFIDWLEIMRANHIVLPVTNDHVAAITKILFNLFANTTKSPNWDVLVPINVQRIHIWKGSNNYNASARPYWCIAHGRIRTITPMEWSGFNGVRRLAWSKIKGGGVVVVSIKDPELSLKTSALIKNIVVKINITYWVMNWIFEGVPYTGYF